MAQRPSAELLLDGGRGPDWQHRLTQCFDLLLQPDEVTEAMRRGCYLCSQGWLKHWRRHLDEMGLADPQLARALFGEGSTRILLIDTGCTAEASEASGASDEADALVQAFAAHVDLPVERRRVGPHFLRLQLSRIAAQARLAHAEQRSQRRLAEAQGQAAEAAMAMDLLGELSDVTSKTELIGRLLNLFVALFAPAAALYLRLDRDADSGPAVVAAEGLAAPEPQLVDELKGFAESGFSAADTASGAGFMMRFEAAGRLLGVLALERFAQPQHRGRYQNLVLQMQGVCVLAMARAEVLEQLQRSEARYRSLFSAMHEGFAVHELINRDEMAEPSYRLLDVNHAFAELAGKPPADLIGQHPEVVAPQLSSVYLPGCTEVVRTGHPHHFEATRATDGRIFDVYAYRPTQGWLAVMLSDVTEQRTAAIQVQHLAHHDGLTGLANRALLEQQARVLLGAMDPRRDHLAVLFCDLDRFKTVNDRLGHATGDALLKEAAERMKALVRRSDLVVRLGGDEFVIVLPGTDPEVANRVAAKLVAVLEQPFELDGERVQLSGSVGVSFYPEDGLDLERLLKAADIALYAAKQHGRNQVSVSPEFGASARSH
jgi:diguanylate cyclase (GGDEF)-like protein